MVGGTSASHGATSGDGWLKIVMNMPALVQYYNFRRIPADAPVTVANPAGADLGAVDFTVEGHPVVLVSNSEKTEDTVEITKVEQSGHSLRVEFRLVADGVRGYALLSSDSGKWVLVERSVAEH